MTVEEMAAEKLRALAQRLRATDLADLAVMLRDGPVNDADIRRLAETKFALVASGNANRVGRIEEHLQELAGTYDDAIGALFPEAPPYRGAIEIVWPRIRDLIP